MTRALLLLACLPLWSCTQFPELDAVRTPGIDSAPYPELLPIGALMDAPPTRIAAGDAASLQARAATLRARAARLGGVDPGPVGVDARADALRDRAAALRLRMP